MTGIAHRLYEPGFAALTGIKIRSVGPLDRETPRRSPLARLGTFRALERPGRWFQPEKDRPHSSPDRQDGRRPGGTSDSITARHVTYHQLRRPAPEQAGSNRTSYGKIPSACPQRPVPSFKAAIYPQRLGSPGPRPKPLYQARVFIHGVNAGGARKQVIRPLNRPHEELRAKASNGEQPWVSRSASTYS